MNIYKLLRKEKKLTQKELADLFYLDQTTVSKWELGKALPDLATLTKLADFYDVSVDYLLGRQENKTEQKKPKQKAGLVTCPLFWVIPTILNLT